MRISRATQERQATHRLDDYAEPALLGFTTAISLYLKIYLATAIPDTLSACRALYLLSGQLMHAKCGLGPDIRL